MEEDHVTQLPTPHPEGQSAPDALNQAAASQTRRARFLYEELLRQVKENEAFSGGHAAKFSNVYYFFRPTTLILAIATTVVSSLSACRNPIITVLAGLVTLVAALDSWLKPQVKWKLHDETNDAFSSMKLRLSSIGDDDFPALDVLRKELDEVVKAYRSARLLE